MFSLFIMFFSRFQRELANDMDIIHAEMAELFNELFNTPGNQTLSLDSMIEMMSGGTYQL